MSDTISLQDPKPEDTKPKSSKAKKIVAWSGGISAAIIIAAVAAGNSNTTTTPTTSAASTPTSTSTASPTASSPTSTAKPVNTFSLGETATAKATGGKGSIDITVSDLKVNTSPTEKYGKAPQNGRFVTLTITAKGSEDAVAGDLSVNPFDFDIVGPDGTKYQHNNGNTIGAIDYDGSLHSTVLNPGEQVKGSISFDVPNGPIRLSYSPGPRTLGYWNLG